jgi:hypothetical protein
MSFNSMVPPGRGLEAGPCGLITLADAAGANASEAEQAQRVIEVVVADQRVSGNRDR